MKLNSLQSVMKQRLFVTISILVILSSCNKDAFNFDKITKVEWDPEFAVPLVNSSVKFSDINLGSNSILQVGADKSLSFVLKNTFISNSASTFVPTITTNPNPSINNFTLSSAQVTAFSSVPINSTYSVASSQNITFSAATTNSVNIDIDSCVLKQGFLKLVVQNSFPHDAAISISIPGVKKNGIPFTTNLNITANRTDSLNIDLVNSNIDLSKNGTTSNQLLVNYSVVLTKKNNTLTGNLNFIIRLNNPILKIIYGDVKQQNITNTSFDSLPIPFFNLQNTIGALMLNDATMKFTVTNSFGIPIGFNFTNFKGFSNANGSFSLNTAGISPSQFVTTSPTVVGQTSTSTLTLTKTNPLSSGSLLNLPGFLSNMPNSITIQGNGQTNPTGVPRPSFKNFILDTSKVKIDGELTIPLDGKIFNFILKDTFDFNFGDVNTVESFIIRTYFNNAFPIDLTGTFRFVDNTFKPIYTIDGVTKPLIKSGIVSTSTGRVITPTATMNDFSVSSDVVPDLGKVKYVIFTVNLSTANTSTQSVKIYSDDYVDVKMGIRAKLKTKL
jgi:hypothetical protein